MQSHRTMLRVFVASGLVLAQALSPAIAEDKKLSVTEASPIKAGLESLVGKSVTLQLSSNQEISGVVEEVGPQAVRIAQLTGKEFYSALVKLDDIVALIYRAK